MASAAIRLSVPPLLAGLAACSLPVLADAEVKACKAQIKATTNHDISGEKQAGWNVNVGSGRRDTTIVFEATAEHPRYLCSLVDEAVTGIVEQRVIYPSAAETEA